MSKRTLEDNQECGYFHEISPIKISRTNFRYFDGTFQVEKRKYVKMVCFDIQKHTAANAASAAKTPIKLEKIQVVPDTHGTENKILINKQSNITCVKSLDFRHNQPHSMDDSGNIDIQHIHDSLGDYQKIQKLDATILQLEPSCVIDVRGTLLSKQEIHIGDKSGTITITVWKDMVGTLRLKQSLCFTNLTVRTYGGKKTLTTTTATTVSEILPIKDVCTDIEPDNQNLSSTGKISQIVVHSNYQCLNCKRKISDVNINDKFIRCPHCQMKQLASSLPNTYFANCNVNSQGSTVKLTIFSSVMTTFLTTANQSALTDAEQIEDFFLQSDELKFTHSKDGVVKEIREKPTQTAAPPETVKISATSSKN